MADSNVPITAGTGTNVDTRTNAGGEHRQVMVLGNDGDVVAGVSPWGAVQTDDGMSTLFYDSWSAGFDTTEKWTVDSRGGSPTLSNGEMTMPATLSTYNAIRSKDVIKPNAGFMYAENGIILEGATAGTGAGRFWGLGTFVSTPAAAQLVQDGVGFEIDQATGALYAVTYVAGLRTPVAVLTRPTDGLAHRYAVYFRATYAYWYIDNMQVPAATKSFPDVDTVELPALIVRQNASSLANSPVFTNVAFLTGDTARQGSAIADPTFGTRMARVTDPAMFVASPLIQALGSQGAALNVNPNALQKRTYVVTREPASGGALAAITTTTLVPKQLIYLHHLAAATTTKRIRRITVSSPLSTAIAYVYAVYRITAAPTAGTTLTPTAVDPGETATTLVTTYLPTQANAFIGAAYSTKTIQASGTVGHGELVLYDWQEGGETKPLTIRAGVLEGFVLTVRVTGTAGPDPTITVTFTEE